MLKKFQNDLMKSKKEQSVLPKNLKPVNLKVNNITQQSQNPEDCLKADINQLHEQHRDLL